MERREFKADETFRLVAVQNLDGTDKVQTRSLYRDRINCIAAGLRYGYYLDLPENYYISMDFVKDERGNWIHRQLITSLVVDVTETENGIKIQTQNSIYIFERAELEPVSYLDEANLIELYLSQEEDYMFAKGIYYDESKQPHELCKGVHVGTFQDSVLIGFLPEDSIQGYACRYFPMGNYVEFYDTLYHQQDYSTPMLIHNTGKSNLEVGFELSKKKTVIPPGESRRIAPFYKKE